MFLTPGKNNFCFRTAKFVSARYVSRAAKLGNICLRNNVSWFRQAFREKLGNFILRQRKSAFEEKSEKTIYFQSHLFSYTSFFSKAALKHAD